MINFHENFDLFQYNTFKINAICKYYFSFSQITELQDFFQKRPELKKLQQLVLGGGSNILFTKNFDGLVIHPLNKEIQIINEDSNNIWVKAGCGVIWDEFVKYCVENDWGGIENLSLIPGNVGACPVQNIGAYGVEVKDVIDEVEAYNIDDFSQRIFKNKDCKFGYRDSIFKNELKNKFIITNVTFKLTKKNHNLILNYGKVDEYLANENNITIEKIRNAVISIRKDKLPDIEKIGSAGSFFKNPIVHKSTADKLKLNFPNAVLFKVDELNYKIAAGWLIEQCGWKGKKVNHVGVYEKQALVLVNHGNGTGNEVQRLALEIQKSVKEKFEIDIFPEVNII